jgi:hypothetical protein
VTLLNGLKIFRVLLCETEEQWYTTAAATTTTITTTTTAKIMLD